MQQPMRLAPHDECNTTISCELEQLKHENVLLCSGTLPPSDQDHELKVVYRCLSKAEHGWNYAHQQHDGSHLADASNTFSCSVTQLVRGWTVAPIRSYTLSTPTSSKTLNSRRGQQQSPPLSNRFRCCSFRHDPHPQTCHTPFRDSGNEASIRVPRMFHSHV
jgi:hypothetical protein